MGIEPAIHERDLQEIYAISISTQITTQKIIHFLMLSALKANLYLCSVWQGGF